MAALHTITNIELISKYMGIEQGNKGESDSLIRKCTEFSSKQNKDNILMLFITNGLLMIKAGRTVVSHASISFLKS